MVWGREKFEVLQLNPRKMGRDESCDDPKEFSRIPSLGKTKLADVLRTPYLTLPYSTQRLPSGKGGAGGGT